jgi:hypothetical protein
MEEVIEISGWKRVTIKVFAWLFILIQVIVLVYWVSVVFTELYTAVKVPTLFQSVNNQVSIATGVVLLIYFLIMLRLNILVLTRPLNKKTAKLAIRKLFLVFILMVVPVLVILYLSLPH